MGEWATGESIDRTFSMLAVALIAYSLGITRDAAFGVRLKDLPAGADDGRPGGWYRRHQQLTRSLGVVRRMMRRVFRSMRPERSEETARLPAIFDELIEYALDQQDVLGILERLADYSVRSFAPRYVADGGFLAVR